MGHALEVLKGRTAAFPLNCERYPAFERDWREEYLRMLLVNTISGVFYASEEMLGEHALALHRFAADENPDFMARALVYARNEGFMRLQPLIGLAVLSLAAPRRFALVFDRVVITVADLVEFTLALQSLGRGQGGRLVKKLACARLERLDEYEALKYSGEGRGYSLKDLLRVYHPKPGNETVQALFRYIAGKSGPDGPDPCLLPRIAAFEKLKRLDVRENLSEAVELIRAGRIPWNALTGSVESMSPELWSALLPDMTLFSLLRHLATLARNGVFTQAEPQPGIEERFSNPETIRKAKILPFRFASAWSMVDVPWLRRALEKAVELSADALPEIPGRTAVLLDISGSMSGQMLQAGALLALSILRKSEGDTFIRLFNTESIPFATRPGESILAAASRIEASGGTNTGVSVREMIASRVFCDTIVIVTDEQQNTGSPFFNVLKGYRRKVNAEVRVFVVNVSPYQFAMVPPEDENTFYCYGWSDRIVSFIADSIRGYGDLVEIVRALE